MKPDLASAVAKATKPPIQNIASQAPFSERMSFQSKTFAISMIATASMATGVAPSFVQEPVAHRAKHMTNTNARTFS